MLNKGRLNTLIIAAILFLLILALHANAQSGPSAPSLPPPPPPPPWENASQQQTNGVGTTGQSPVVSDNQYSSSQQAGQPSQSQTGQDQANQYYNAQQPQIYQPTNPQFQSYNPSVVQQPVQSTTPAAQSQPGSGQSNVQQTLRQLPPTPMVPVALAMEVTALAGTVYYLKLSLIVISMLVIVLFLAVYRLRKQLKKAGIIASKRQANVSKQLVEYLEQYSHAGYSNAALIQQARMAGHSMEDIENALAMVKK